MVRDGSYWYVASYHLTFPIPNPLAKDMCSRILSFEQTLLDRKADRAAAELLAELDAEDDTTGKASSKKKGKAKGSGKK